MKKITVVLQLLVALALTLLAGCGGGSGPDSTAPLSAGNINLIFVVSPDLANDPLGDINPTTANLSNQGLQRSLLMATYLKQQLLGANNVTDIYTLEPMTHLQTANNYPDMVAIGFIQQFALLNQKTVQGTTANSFPINAGYAPGDVPAGVFMPNPYVPRRPGAGFQRRKRQQCCSGKRHHQRKRPGIFRFLGALGDRQRPADRHQTRPRGITWIFPRPTRGQTLST